MKQRSEQKKNTRSSTGGLKESTPPLSVIQETNPLNPARVRNTGSFNFAQQSDPETYNKVQKQKQDTKQAQSNRLTELQNVYDQSQGQGASQAVQQQVQNRPQDTIIDPSTEQYSGIGNNVAVGLNKAYEGLLKVPRFVYSAAAVPQNFLADQLDMPGLGAKYENFLELTNSTPVRSPLTMLDQLGDYYSDQAEGYAAKTQKYDDTILGSLNKGNFKQAGSQILDQIAESAPSIAVMAMTSGAGNAANLGQTSKTLANALPFMSQRNAELQDDGSIPEWLKPVNAAANGLAEVIFDQSFGTQAAIQGIVNRFKNDGRDAAINAAKELTGGFMNGALKTVDVLKPFTKGAIEEGSTQLAQNIVDKYTIDPEKDLMEGVPDAMIVGSAMTGGLETAGNIALPKQRTQVRELESQQQALLNELGNENLSPESREGISKMLQGNKTAIESLAKKTQETISKLNPEQKKQVADLNEKAIAAEVLVNDPNVSDEAKKVAEQQIKTITKEVESIKPEEGIKEAVKETKTLEATQPSVEAVESTEESVNNEVVELQDMISQAEEIAVQHEQLAKVETDPVEKAEALEIARNAREVIEKSEQELLEISNEETAVESTEKVVAQDVYQKRNEEILAKAEDDLKALKQVENKVKKYEAMTKRITDAKNNKEITVAQFNDLKKRYDEVIGESSVKQSKIKEEPTDAIKIGEIEQSSQPERKGATEQQQGKQEDRINEEKPVTTSQKKASSSNRAEQGGKEQKIADIQIKRQSIKDRISEKLKAQRSEVKSGFDPSLLKDFVELGSTYIEEGIVKASDFIKRFREDYKDLGFDDSTLTDEDIANEVFNKARPKDQVEKEAISKDIKEVGLTKEAVKELRAGLGEEQFTYDVKQDAERIREAKQLIKEGFNIKGLVDRMTGEENYLPSAVEVEVLKLYYSSLTDAINKNPTPENIKKRTDLLKAIDLVKVSQGRSVQAWDGLTAVEDNLANFLEEESRYSTLTQKEIAELSDKYNKAKEALDEYKRLQEEANSKAIEKKAKEIIAKAAKDAKNKTVKADFKAERKKYVEDFRAELRKIRATPSAVILPYTRELMAATPFVRKMVQSYVNEQIYDLKQIVKGIHEELSQDIPEITENDVRDIIAGQYTDPKKTKNAKLAQIHDLQRQAKLEAEIEKLNQGIIETKSGVQKKAKSDRVLVLEEEIKEIKKRNPELFAPKLIEQAEEAAKKNIQELEKRLADNDISFKEINKPTSVELTEFRKRQQELREELEARRKEAEIGRYSEDAKLDSRKKWYNNKIEALKKQIREGEYEAPIEPVPVLLDAEALKLKDEYMRFKEETRKRRDNAEFEASSKWNKAFNALQQVAGVRRLVQTSIDLSIPLRQGISVMMNVGIPFYHEGTTGLGIKAYEEMAGISIPQMIRERSLKAGLTGTLYSQKNYDRLMFDLENSPEFLQSKEDGIVYAEVGSSNNENRDEHHRDSFMYRIPYIKAPLLASERAASGWQNYARYQLYLRGEKMLQAEGKTRQNDKKAYEQMAARVMVDTGRGKIPGIKDVGGSTTDTAIKQGLGLTLYGARLASAIFRKLNPMYYLNPKVDPKVRIQALKDMAGYASGALITGLGFVAMGYTVSFDYDDPDFLKARKGKKVIDFLGGMSTYIRTYLRLLTAVYKRADPDVSHEDANKYAKFATSSVGTFFRNKLAPNTSYFTNMLMGENTIGEKFNPWEIIQIYPMYGDDIVKSFKEGSPLDLLTIIPVSISGLGYMEYDKDVRRANLNVHLDRKDDQKVISFLKQHQLNLQGDINQELYDINTGGKTRMTAQQSDKYEKIWADYIKDELKEPGEIAELSKLNEKDFKKEINKIKLDATKYAKFQITGLSEGITTIREDEKTYQLTPQQVKERIKLNKEYIDEYGSELKDDLIEKYTEEGMSKKKATKKAELDVQRKANTYSKNVMVGEEKDNNDGKITFKEKE